MYVCTMAIIFVNLMIKFGYYLIKIYKIESGTGTDSIYGIYPPAFRQRRKNTYFSYCLQNVIFSI